jgi:hypothetical protein
MSDDKFVFMLTPSFEDYRPSIEFDVPANQGIDWLLLRKILLGERTTSDYQEASLMVSNPAATSWGFYSVPGTLGLISEQAVTSIGSSAFRFYNLLPARLNDRKYFFLKPVELLACLDMEKSLLIPFRINPNRIKDIKKYGFHKSRISDPLIFSIPELPGLFATPGVKEAVVRNQLQGFHFNSLE